MSSPAPPPRVLLCRVAARQVALPADEVVQVMPLPPVWRPPTLPAPLLGFVQLAERALPVLSLAALLGGVAEESLDLYAHVVRLRGEDAPGLAVAGLAVDRALGFAEPVAASRVAAAASLGGVVIAELDFGTAGVAHLLDPRALLADAGRQALARLTAQAEARRAEWAAA